MKAKLDGEYVQRESLGFDIKCFLGTIFSVLRSDGVVEGGTGEIHKKEKTGPIYPNDGQTIVPEDDYQTKN